MYEVWVDTVLWAAAWKDNGSSSQSRRARKMSHLFRGISFHVNFTVVLRDHFYNHKVPLKWTVL